LFSVTPLVVVLVSAISQDPGFIEKRDGLLDGDLLHVVRLSRLYAMVSVYARKRKQS
jgi:hypothetical protein